MRYSNKNREKPSCLTCEVNICFIKNCSKKWQEFAASNKTTTIYKKGISVILQNNLVLGIFFIYYGKVKVTKFWGGEKEQIIRFATSGNILGHRGFGGKENRYYPISAFTLDESQICFFESDVINELLRTNVRLANSLMQFYAEELYKTEVRMNIISQKPVRERVAIAIIELRNIFGYEKGTEIIDLVISRQELADFVSTTRENASKYISEFKQANIISTDRNRIEILNLSELYAVGNFNTDKIL